MKNRRALLAGLAGVGLIVGVVVAVVQAQGSSSEAMTPPECPATTLTRTGPQTAQVYQANSGGTWDLTGATWDGNAPRPITYPIRSESWTQGCIVGGAVHGNTPRDATRDQWYNQAGGYPRYGGETHRQTMTNTSGNFLVIRDSYASDYEDAFDPNSATVDSTTWLDHVHAEYIRDDCIENEDVVHNMVLSDSLFDGCFTGFGFRPSGSSTAQDGTAPASFTVEDSLVYIRPQPLGPAYCSASGVTRGRCLATSDPNVWLGAYGIWKWSNQAPATVTVRNTIFRLDVASYSSCSSQKWPAGTYENVTVVWTGAGPYGSTGDCTNVLPAGVTLTTDVSVWDDAKAAWLNPQQSAPASESTPEPTPEPTPTPLSLSCPMPPTSVAGDTTTCTFALGNLRGHPGGLHAGPST